jgi:hypothetical protein
MGKADLSPLGPFERADQLRGAVWTARDVVPNATNHLTARFIDEQLPAGPRTYIHAFESVASAYEHSDALWALINGPHGLTPRAPWTLVRSIFEASFWGAWILDSELSFVRRQRGLRVEMVDRSEERKWVNAVTPDPETRSKMGRSAAADVVYRAECKSLDLDWNHAGRSPSMVDELAKLSIVDRGGVGLSAAFVSTWRSLSGLQHGHAYAAQVHTDRTPGVKIVGGMMATASVRDSVFVAACQCAYGLLIEAAELCISRSREATRSR